MFVRSGVSGVTDAPAARRSAGNRDAPATHPRLTGAMVWACGLGGAVAALGSLRPWARAALVDRGADLLVVTRTGWDLNPSGQAVCISGLVVALVCVLESRTDQSRRVRYLLPFAGIVIASVAVSRLGAGDPVARKLERLQIGTFQTDHPVAVAMTGSGLWISLAAGVVIVASGVGWLALDRKSPASRAGSVASPP